MIRDMSDSGAYVPSQAPPDDGAANGSTRLPEAASRRRWIPVSVLLVLTLICAALSFQVKQDCRSTGWATPAQFVHACYSDIPALFYARGLAEGKPPYFADVPPDQHVEYPVLTGAVMWATALMVPENADPGTRSRWYFDVNFLFLVIVFAVAVVATARTTDGHWQDAAMVAVAPGWVLAGTVNWDLWAVMLTALATLAWARNRTVLAGVWLGLAVAMKFYPLLLLGPFFLLCLRAARLKAFACTALAAAGAWLAVNVPVMVANFDGWARFYVLSRERGAGFSSVWLVLQQRGSVWVQDPERLNPVALAVFVACCAAIAILALLAPRRPRVAQLAFLTVAAFILTNKVYSPQYVTWLVPLAVLARPSWRDFLVWQAAEVVHFFGIWRYLAGYPPADPAHAISAETYHLTVLVHVFGTLWFAAVVVRDALVPSKDPVRRRGADDSAGGPLDGADDVVSVTRLSGRTRRAKVPVTPRA